MARQLRSFVLPFLMVIIVPTILSLIFPPPGIQLLRLIVAAPIGVGGMVLFFMSVKLFIQIGRGTLAPWDPTCKLVVAGPYRFCRNPMITGVLFLLLAQTVALASVAILSWALFFFLANHIYFVYVEEPGLTSRFGDEYINYKSSVPRWLPLQDPGRADKNTPLH